MRPMAMNTETILFLTVPLSRSLAVYACLPVTENITMTLAAKII
jgi:hypothetical protein